STFRTGRLTLTLVRAASRACPPAGVAVSFSDSLDKLVYHGVELGGLSSLAWDPRSAAWVSAVVPVPARFAVTGTTPEGQATSNATLEGSRSRVPAARSSRPWRAPCPATFRPAALAAWLRQSCRMAPVRAVPLRRKGSLRSCVLRS